MNALNRIVCFALVVAALGACASGTGQSRYGAEIPVRDTQSLAGRWSGIVQSAQDQREDFLDVTVGADGTYESRTARTIGVFEGRGRIDVQDGRLRVTGEKTVGHGTLYDKDGKRTMVLQLTAPNGRQFTVRLTPRQ